MKKILGDSTVSSKTEKEYFAQKVKEYLDNPELYSIPISREELYARFPKIAPIKK